MDCPLIQQVFTFWLLTAMSEQQIEVNLSEQARKLVKRCRHAKWLNTHSALVKTFEGNSLTLEYLSPQ